VLSNSSSKKTNNMSSNNNGYDYDEREKVLELYDQRKTTT